ncbi:peritrophin-48-like [Procambarus clarkii]|uniref:peritrophin-48-like n=1 Tax=Procambarus clarkii TaxID=6728 RepID=UPI003743A7AA
MTKPLLQESIWVAWVAVLVYVTQVLAQRGCDPSCDGLVPGTLVADRYDCTRYYICVNNNEPVNALCPAGTSFNATAPICTGTLPCNNNCTLPPCSTECITEPDSFNDPKDCSTYYICIGGSPQGPFKCPANTPYYNSEKGVCGTTPSGCCRDPCAAFCTNGQLLTRDPYDCHKFYKCVTAGPADETNHLTCTSGSNFDVVADTCLPGAVCDTLCDASQPITTTATPECKDSMTCTSVGFFPKCTSCDQHYFECEYVNQIATVNTCEGDKVFNPDPAYPHCISPTACPFNPSFRAPEPPL